MPALTLIRCYGVFHCCFAVFGAILRRYARYAVIIIATPPALAIDTLMFQMLAILFDILLLLLLLLLRRYLLPAAPIRAAPLSIRAMPYAASR